MIISEFPARDSASPGFCIISSVNQITETLCLLWLWEPLAQFEKLC